MDFSEVHHASNIEVRMDILKALAEMFICLCLQDVDPKASLAPVEVFGPGLPLASPTKRPRDCDGQKTKDKRQHTTLC